MILACHSQLAVPHPPHIVRYFRPIEASYGDLHEDEPFGRLSADIARLIRWHIYPWDVSVDAERAAKEAPIRDCMGLYAAYMEQYREAHGRARWVCKSTFMVEELAALTALFPAPKVIWLVRDPRDVAVSSRRSVFSTFHPYFTAKLWTKQQDAALAVCDGPPLRTPPWMKLLYFEDLLREPEAELRRLCAFIDEPFEASMLNYFESKEARRSAALSRSWENTAAPIRTDRVGQYHAGLSREEQQMVEALASPTMLRLGYPLTFPVDQLSEIRWSPGQIREFAAQDRAERQNVERRSMREDRNHLRRRRRDVLIRWLRRRYGR